MQQLHIPVQNIVGTNTIRCQTSTAESRAPPNQASLWYPFGPSKIIVAIAVSFSDLANELIDGSFGYLEEADLLAASKVSKQFRIFSEPLVYRNVRLIYRGGARVHLLLRTLLHRPGLASHIWSFKISSWRFPLEPSTYTEADLQLRNSFMLSTGIIPEDIQSADSIQDARLQDTDIEVALVLSLCTNIKSLNLIFDIPTYFEDDGQDFQRLCQSMVNTL